MLSGFIRRLYRLARPVHLPRRLLARILSTFLCVLAVVIRPCSRIGGTNAFLVLSLKELVFSVQEDLAQQIEITILNITGALLGIGVSTFAKYLSALPHINSLSSRLIPALFLALVAFFAGWAKSRLPRLHLSARISCFISIWLLTQNVGEPSSVLPDTYSFLWITFTAAAICLLSSILVLHWSSTHLVEELSATLQCLHDCLSLSIDGAFAPLTPKQIQELTELQKDLVTKSASLNQLYSQASFELRLGRVALKHLKPLLGITEHLRRDLSWGMSYHRCSQSVSLSDPECASTHPFQSSALELAGVILASLKAAKNLVLVAYTHPTFHRRSIELERNAVVSASINLNLAWYSVQQNLRNRIHEASDHGSHFPPEWHQQSLFAASLLQMAYDTSHILHASQRVAAHHESSSIRLFYPCISLQWLGVSPRTFATEEDVAVVPSEPLENETQLSPHEVKQGMATAKEFSTISERGPIVCSSTLCKASQLPRPSICTLLYSIPTLFAWLWNRPQTLHVRLAVSRTIRKIHHSSHLQHAFKNAIGVAALSIPAYLPANSAGHNWFTTFHGQWIIISYVWVLETNTGATWRIGYLRLSGTILGATYSYLTVLACNQNPYGIVVMVTAFDIIVSCIIMKSTFPSVGVVASVTLPPVVLAQYLTNLMTYSALDLALIRAATIAIGILCALAMNALVFPRHSRVLFLNQTSRTLGLLSQLYLLLGRDLFRELYVFTPHDKQRSIKLEFHIRSALQRSSYLLIAMSEELSLVPKPMRHYREVVQILQKILDLMTGLRKVRENIPRRETVIPIIKERREFISCVCLTLFASEQVFRARHPLPQFFPSSRQSLEVLAPQIESQLWRAIREDQSLVRLKLALVYSLAECEIMKKLVEALEALLELCRELFGTSAWLIQSSPESVGEEYQPTSPGTPGDTWYSTIGRV